MLRGHDLPALRRRRARRCRPGSWPRSRASSARARSRTARPPPATTRCASRSRCARWRRSWRSSRRSATSGFSREARGRATSAGTASAWPAARAAYSVNQGLWGCTIGGRETNDTIEPLPESAWVLTARRVRHPAGAGVATARLRARRAGLARRRAARPGGADRGAQRAGPAPTASAAASTSATRSSGSRGGSPSRRRRPRVLIAAHRELEKLVLTARQQRVKDQLAAIYGDLVHEGQFLEPACRDIEALFAELAGAGDRRGAACSCGPGSLFVEGVASPLLAARPPRAAVYGEAAGEWTAADARGFSRMLGAAGDAARARAARDGCSSEERPARQDRLGHPQLPALARGAARATRSPPSRAGWSRCAC